MKISNNLLIDTIKLNNLYSDIQNDELHVTVRNIVKNVNNKINIPTEITTMDYDKELVDKFLNDDTRYEEIKHSNVCSNFMKYIYSNITKIDNINNLNKFMTFNKEYLYDIANKYGIGCLSSLLDYVLCQNISVGRIFEEFNDLYCIDFERINKYYYDDYLRKEAWNTVNTPKTYLYNYMYYLAISNSFNDLDHYTYLFYLLSKFDINNIDSRMDIYWSQILSKYVMLLAKNNNIDNLVVLFDCESYGVKRNNTYGYLNKIDVDKKLYYVININYPTLTCWKHNLNTANHELEHIKFENNIVSYNCFLSVIDYYAYVGVKPEFRSQYNKDNYRRTYTEYVAHNKGYSYEKELEENSQFINLDRIDKINKILENNSQYEECNTRIINNKEYNIFSLFRQGIKNTEHILFLKNGFKYKTRDFIHPILKFILDDNYEVLPYESINILYNNALNNVKNHPNEKYYLELLKIYEWTLKNYTLELGPLSKEDNKKAKIN